MVNPLQHILEKFGILELEVSFRLFERINFVLSYNLMMNV